ncbi:MAG: NAD(P)/FAD-dependent oxidoreductase, partial [Nocardioidaceae bacterium]
MIDLLVAGGGPVGLATAIRARLAGLEVTVVEPRDDPVDKACGEGLMPGAVAGLRVLGVEPRGRPFEGIRYVSDRREVRARFRAGPGLGVRRTVLHDALAARATELGVRRVRGRVGGVQQGPDHVEAGGLS